MIVKKVTTKKGTPPRSRARHVRDLCDYIAGPEAGDQAEKVEHRAARHLLSLDHEAQVMEMSDLAGTARADAQPMQHWILSWRSGEQPTTGQADDAARLFLTELGLAEHQAIYALHRDTDNWHLHLAINRVHPETERLVTVNGGFDIEAAHRGIARIERDQGWEAETRARYRVSDVGAVERRPDITEGERQPSSRARDLETRTGEMSAQRAAIEEGAYLIRQARNWPELHEVLAAHGMRLERKGSGAILWVGQTAVKASAAGRDCSMSALQKRLGEFQPAAAGGKAHRPERQAAGPDSEHWRLYIAARQAHHEVKTRALGVLERRSRSEWSDLTTRHREERRQALGGNWRGKGAALNAVRSLLAARQAQEKAALRERHQHERRAGRDRHPRWPSFEDWLRTKAPEQAEQWRFRDPPATITGDTPVPGRPMDIRACAAQVTRWGIHYLHEGQQGDRPAFTDRGRRIVVHDFDKATVLAALQLASQKWGTIRVSGPASYQRMCVALAAEHGFKVTNPELQTTIAAARSVPPARLFPPVALPQFGPRERPSTTMEPQASPGGPRIPKATRALLLDAAEAYRHHLADLRSENREHWDVSRLDATAAFRLRLSGFTRRAVERAIREVAANRGEPQRRDWTEYSRRVAQHAFGVPGDVWLARMAPTPEFSLRFDGQVGSTERSIVLGKKIDQDR